MSPILLWAALALAAAAPPSNEPPNEPPSEPPPAPATEAPAPGEQPAAAAPRPAPAAEAPPPAAPQLTLVGVDVAEAVVVPEFGQLNLKPCIGQMAAAPKLSDDGALLLQLRIRRGRVSLVGVEVGSLALAPLTPCLERELVRVDWGVKKADVKLKVTVADGPSAGR